MTALLYLFYNYVIVELYNYWIVKFTDSSSIALLDFLLI